MNCWASHCQATSTVYCFLLKPPMHWCPVSVCRCDLPLQHVGVILWVAFVQSVFCHCQLEVCAAGPWGAQSKRDAAAPDERRVHAQAAGCLQGECHLQIMQLLHLSCPVLPLFPLGSSLLQLLCPLRAWLTCGTLLLLHAWHVPTWTIRNTHMQASNELVNICCACTSTITQQPLPAS